MTDEAYDSTTSLELQVVSINIFGEAASKSNSRKIVRYGGVSRLIKSQKALTYSDVFQQQCPVLPVLMTGDIRMTLHIWYASRRPDLDETLILDLLQGCIYVNDRQVKERHCYWHLDKENPRAEILIEQIPDVEMKKKPLRKRGL
jgi:Holliday junction resolvase RusA-like endonuclease